MRSENDDNRPADAKRENDVTEPAPREDYSVLYVDDDPDNLLVFRSGFGIDHDVKTCTSGEEALAILEREEVAVLLTDHRMVGMSGVELCEVVRERHPAVRRIVITAYADQKTALEAINRGGVHAFLVKPWDEAELRRVLDDELERYHLERTVSLLRGELADRDRQLGVALERDRLLHDLGGVTQRLSVTCRAIQKTLERAPGRPPGEVLQEIDAQTERLQRAVKHLTELHREQRPAVTPPQPEVLPLEDVLEAVRELSAVDHSRVRMSMQRPEGLAVCADRLGLTRILLNLLSNAKEAVEGHAPGRGRIHLAAAAVDENTIGIEVHDSGPGVAPEDRDRIFEDRYTTKRERGGSGLGLSASRAIAEANRGALELTASNEGGACFRLLLPRARPPDGSRRDEAREQQLH